MRTAFNIKLPIEFLLLILVIGFVKCSTKEDNPDNQPPISTSITYFVDSKAGSDSNNGKALGLAWKSLAVLDTVKLNPGDTVRFKRGSEFEELLTIRQAGAPNKNITFSDYGDKSQPAPSFTNKAFLQENFGNCIRIKGSYVILENLYFHHTAIYAGGNNITDGGWTEWKMGAIFIDKTAKNCIIRNNEVFDCPVGIKSYGENVLITKNYIHDCNRVMREWNWGPIAIWLGGDYQEVSYNRVFNYRAENKNMVFGGAGGGAIEVDDSRNPKSHIDIHHNYSRDCQGFLETTALEQGIVTTAPDYRDFSIHHNISDDYQQFILLWRGSNFKIENNTVIRRKVNSNNIGVFKMAQANGKNIVKNNIVITENNEIIFSIGGSLANDIIQYNLYYAASGSLVMGQEGPGEFAVTGVNPLLVNYLTGNTLNDFALTKGSPAIDKGIYLGYNLDLVGTPIPQGGGTDLGVFEYK